MRITEIKRPNYYEGQYLGAQDLVAAQEYQHQQDQRHRLAAHTWGIAAGLELEEQAKPGDGEGVDVYIKPGYAVDGFGRAIVVLERYKVPEALFAQFKPQAGTTKELIPVWLRYREVKTDPPKPGFAICGDEEQMYRVRETFILVVGEISASQLDKISVGGTLVGAFDAELDGSVPYQALPDPEDDSRWLIYLGSVSWSGTEFVKSDNPITLSFGRPYIGAIADRILAPAGILRIRDRRKPMPSKETPDFAAIEGSLRVDGAANFRDLVITDSFLNVDSKNRNDGKLYFDPSSPELTSPGLTFGFASFEGIGSKRTAGGNWFGLDFYTAAVARLSITNDGNVGIGTSAPPRKLSVVSEIHSGGAGAGLSFGNRTSEFVGAPSAGERWVWYADQGTARLWSGSDKLAITPDGNTGFGTNTPAAGLKVDIQGDFGRSDGPSVIHLWGSRIGDAGDAILFLRSVSVVAFDGPNNRVGIGTSTPGYKLDVAGEVHASNFPSSSDDRLKTNIAPLTNVVERIRKIRGISFDWNEKYAALGRSTNRREVGVLANEVKAVFPELVSAWGDENYLAVDYGRFTAVLLEAVKELTSEIEALRGKIDALERPAKNGQEAE